MIIFCAFEQMQMVIEEGKKHGLMKSYPLIFVKNFSAQVLKANMKVVNACEYAVVLYRDKLPKFRNIGADGKGHMVFNWFEWERDGKDIPKIHPTQKPVNVLKKLIEIFTDEGDVVIDPVAGSGSTLRACMELNRSCYGFEIKKNFYKEAQEKLTEVKKDLEKRNITDYDENDILLPFKFGAVKMAQETNSLIVPFGITGDYKVNNNNLTLRYGTPINVSNMDLEEANNILRNDIKRLVLENRK